MGIAALRRGVETYGYIECGWLSIVSEVRHTVAVTSMGAKKTVGRFGMATEAHYVQALYT